MLSRNFANHYFPAMKIFRSLIVIQLSFFSLFASGQQSSAIDSGINHRQDFKDRPVEEISNPFNKKRVRLVTAANIAGYGGALIVLNESWYKQQPRSAFHFFNDNAEWLQVDKVGHLYSAYSESRASMELWRWAGVSRNKRIWLGGLSGAAYQSIIEILDGFSSEYGFSPGDFVANIVGSGIFTAQEFAWDQQKIKIKISFHTNSYGEPDLDERADVLYGKGLERFLKDYNAQTYWASANIRSIFTCSSLPRWLSVAAGYGANGLFGARSNIAKNDAGVVNFDRSDIQRYRQWYLSPDIDFMQIRTNKKGLKFLFFVLSAVKFPAPALEFSKGKFKGHWLIF